MRNLVRKIHDDAAPAVDPVTQETGRVLAVRAGPDGGHPPTPGGVVVATASGEHEAARAVSCLVAPEAGDVVLLARSPREGAFVLAILRREAGRPTALVADGDLDVRLGSGRLRVAARDGVDLVSAKDVSVVAGRLDVNASEGSMVLQRLSFLGEIVRAEIDRVKILAGTVDSALDRLSQRVKRSYRTVEETDQLRAARVDYTADQTMSLHAEQTLVTADELVKIDGEQIHLG